ncbi:MAG: hypothetical protein HKP25_04065 [Marinicaulis sp.]|nr:hypothetical protein [Marinicaulis sp.]NNL88222.1 hypothetical protein [Marinicaulis sp.]
MIFRKYATRSLIVVWAAATGLSAALAYAVAAAAPARSDIVDIRVGERAGQTRIAILCANMCSLAQDENGDLILQGAAPSINLDLTMRSKRLTRFSATPFAGGARLSVESNQPIASIAAKNCKVGGENAVCADFFFGVKIASTAKKIDPPAPSLKSRRVAAVSNASPDVAAAPILREGAEERYRIFASLAAPERLAPPEGAILAKLQPIEEPVTEDTPKFRTEEPLVAFGVFDFRERVKVLLGKSLTSEHCTDAEAKLQADPWALTAMVDLGLCSSARGDTVEGDAIFARILEYTPDNFEALVGRALIAEQAGEIGAARKHYQDALNALPPIEESKRIVAAMAALDGA